MKKVYSVLASLLAVGLVSAETNAEVVGGGVLSLFTNIFADTALSISNISIILFGFLIWMVLYSVVKKIKLFEGMSFAAPIVSVILTIISFIYVPREIFNVAGSNVGALGATIITILPILIAFYFTTKVTDNQSTARVIWAGFLAYYIVILIYTYAVAPVGSSFFSLETGHEEFKNLFYAVGALFSLCMIIFLPMIRGKMWDFDMDTKKEQATRRAEVLKASLDSAERIHNAQTGTDVG